MLDFYTNNSNEPGLERVLLDFVSPIQPAHSKFSPKLQTSSFISNLVQLRAVISIYRLEINTWEMEHLPVISYSSLKVSKFYAFINLINIS